MSKKNSPKQNPQNANNKKSKFSILNPFRKKTTTNTQDGEADEKVEERIHQRTLTIIHIFTLIAFIIVNYLVITKSDRNAQVQLRAYVGVTDITFNQYAVGENLWVTVAYNNSGQTPAHNVKLQTGIKTFGKEITETDWDSLKFYKRVGISLSPKIKFETQVFSSHIVTAIDTIQWNSGAKILACFGKIFYDDVFGDTHYSEFSYAYSPQFKKLMLTENHNRQY